MAKKQFKAESKRLLDIMINSIYTHKDIFLRELISNASDALDKKHYVLLTDNNKDNDDEELYIRLTPNKEERTLTISDNGIGMNKSELEENLGTIAKSGSLAFKLENNIEKNSDIIGQFGVGFYSAFMVADKVTVISKKKNEQAYIWQSNAEDGYTIDETNKEKDGTDIILHIKTNTDDDNYDNYLENYYLKELVKKNSNFIKFPIKMVVEKSRPKKDNDKEYETYNEDEVLNSMVPIWHQDKKKLKEEDYNNFYQEQHFGYDKPLKVIQAKIEGIVNYDTLLFIPSEIPFDFYSKEFEKGLELYSNNVLITEKCNDLLPDYFGFIKGVVDSPDVSLNISRELLQHNKQLQFIAKNIKEKVKKELLSMLKDERDKYKEFFNKFGKSLKIGVYNDWGVNKEFLQDLLMFYSSKEKDLVTLDEYVNRMKEDQKYIYYATGEDINKIDKLPQTEIIKEQDNEILYFTDEIDEFSIKMLNKYKDKEFKSVSNGDLDASEKEKNTIENEKYKDLFKKMKDILGTKVKDIRVSNHLKSHPVCITNVGDISVEMEKALKMMPNNENLKAEKILEINPNHEIFKILEQIKDDEKLTALTNVLYNQALLIEGLSVDDPVSYANEVYKLIK